MEARAGEGEIRMEARGEQREAGSAKVLAGNDAMSGKWCLEKQRVERPHGGETSPPFIAFLRPIVVCCDEPLTASVGSLALVASVASAALVVSAASVGSAALAPGFCGRSCVTAKDCLATKDRVAAQDCESCNSRRQARTFEAAANDQPFTEPAAKPDCQYFCNPRNKKISGTTPNSAPNMTAPF